MRNSRKLQCRWSTTWQHGPTEKPLPRRERARLLDSAVTLCVEPPPLPTSFFHRLLNQVPHAPQDHDARAAGVHTAIPPSHPAWRLPSNPPLWATGQWQSQRVPGTGARRAAGQRRAPREGTSDSRAGVRLLALWPTTGRGRGPHARAPIDPGATGVGPHIMSAKPKPARNKHRSSPVGNWWGHAVRPPTQDGGQRRSHSVAQAIRPIAQPVQASALVQLPTCNTKARTLNRPHHPLQSP